MKKAIARYKTEVAATQPKYAGIPVTRPQGMWLVYLDMLGIKWEMDEEPKEVKDVLLVRLSGKSLFGTAALIVPTDFILRKYQRDIAQQMKDESIKALLILGQAPEVLQAGIRKMSYIRRGRNGLFHEHAYISCKGTIQNLNNTTFVNGFAALPKESTTAYLTYSTDNDDLLERHNKAADMAWRWDFDKDGRCIEVEEPKDAQATEKADEPQDDDITFITKSAKPDDPVFMAEHSGDVVIGVSTNNRVRFTFTQNAARKITDTDHVKVSQITADNAIYFMEGGDDDFKLSKYSCKSRPFRVQVKQLQMQQRIIDLKATGEYDLRQVTTKSGTKYWCVRLEANHAK